MKTKGNEMLLGGDASSDNADLTPQRFSLASADVAGATSITLRNFIAQMFPECLTEGRIDFEQLRRMLGDWVEAGQERFGLTWPGKAACMKIIQQSSVGSLRPRRVESIDFDATENVF